jgi:hypothetical protein
MWLDCIFGSFPEWFNYVDERTQCAMAPTMWAERLETADFINIQTCVESGASGCKFFFLAQKSFLHPSPACDLPINHWHIYSYEIGKEIELQTQLRALDTNVSLTVYLLTM